MHAFVPQLAARLPGVDPRLIDEHLARLDARYFERFAEEQVAEHLRLFSILSRDRPAGLVVRDLPDGSVACTVLAATGLDITGGGPRAAGPRVLELRMVPGRSPSLSRILPWE